MEPLAEARDLKDNPLPFVVIVDPLTRVWDLDGQIAALRDKISTLVDQRTEALNYALDNVIEEDSRCKLVAEKHTSTPNQKIDVVKLRAEIPKAYERVWDLKRSEAKAAFEKFGDKVEDNKATIDLSQKILDPALKAEGHKLEEILIPGGLTTISYTYTVVLK